MALRRQISWLFSKRITCNFTDGLARWLQVGSHGIRDCVVCAWWNRQTSKRLMANDYVKHSVGETLTGWFGRWRGASSKSTLSVCVVVSQVCLNKAMICHSCIFLSIKSDGNVSKIQQKCLKQSLKPVRIDPVCYLDIHLCWYNLHTEGYNQ